MHKEFGLVWFCSTITVLFQYNTHRRFNPYWIYSFSFLVLYIILTATMPTVLNDTNLVHYSIAKFPCTTTASGCQCPSGVLEGAMCRYFPNFTINVGHEILLVIGLCFVIMLMSSLQYHVSTSIEYNTETLLLTKSIVDHSNVLKTELMQIHNENRHIPALDSPITKVIRMIRMLQLEDDSLDQETADRLDYVVHLLGSPQLFEPQLQDTNMESDVNQWLKQITNHEEMPDDSSLFQLSSKERSGSALKKKPDVSWDPVIREALANVDSWDFNVFNLSSVTNGSPLFHLVMDLFDTYKFEECLNVPKLTMMNFIKQVENSYRKVNDGNVDQYLS
jgi:hypothetical protein